jgi:hypothetical protein
MKFLMYDGQRTYEVAWDYYVSLRREILSIVPALFPEVAYTVEVLLGSDFWDPLNDDTRKLSGRCVAHMVRHGEVPLRRMGCRHRYPARYALK